MKCKALVGWFENSREKGTNALFYFIIIVCYLIYRKRKWSSWQGIWLMTFRTWVRSQVPPPLSLYFSFKCIPMQFQHKESIIHPLVQIATHTPRSIKRPWFEEHSGHESTPSHAGKGSQKGPWSLGPELLQYTSQLGTDPPRFAIFLSLFFIYFNYCFFSINSFKLIFL